MGDKRSLPAWENSNPGKKISWESLEKSHFRFEPWSEKRKLKKKVKENLVIKSWDYSHRFRFGWLKGPVSPKTMLARHTDLFP